MLARNAPRRAIQKHEIPDRQGQDLRGSDLLLWLSLGRLFITSLRLSNAGYLLASFVLVRSNQCWFDPPIIQLETPVNCTKQDLRLQGRSLAVAGLTRRCCVISSSYVRPLRNISTRTGTGAATTACTPFTPIASTGCRYSIQPQYGLQAILLHDEKTLLSCAECRTRIGQPTAARIISFLQPTQHL